MAQRSTASWVVVLAFFAFGLVALAPQTFAENNLTVQIFSNVVTPETCPAPYDSPHDFILSKCDGTAKTFGTLQIAARDTTQGPARVETSDTTGMDSIKLLNAKIWSTAAPPANCDAWDLNGINPRYVYCPDIVFFADFDAGPDGSSSNPVTFYRKAKGDLKKGTSGATGSSFRVEGIVQGVTIQGPAGKEALSTSFSFDLPTTNHWTGSGTRRLLGHIWFHLKFANTHVLNLEYVGVDNPPGG